MGKDQDISMQPLRPHFECDQYKLKDTRLGWRGKQGRGCLCSNDDQVVSGFGLGLKQELSA